MRPSRTWSSRSRTRATPCCAASGSGRARSSAPRARTGSRPASSTTPCSSAPRFVCCDSLEQARIEAGDLVEPVERGVLDWLEVHELAEVVGGEATGRQHDDDIVVFKSLGIAAEDVAVAALVYDRARERGVGVEL